MAVYYGRVVAPAKPDQRPTSWFFWFEHMPAPAQRTMYALGSTVWAYNLAAAMVGHAGPLWKSVCCACLFFGLRSLASVATPIDGES